MTTSRMSIVLLVKMASVTIPSYEFIKTIYNTEPGLLVTHECLRYNRKREVGDVLYFRCTKATMGCTGSAVVTRIEIENK